MQMCQTKQSTSHTLYVLATSQLITIPPSLVIRAPLHSGTLTRIVLDVSLPSVHVRRAIGYSCANQTVLHHPVS